MSRKEYFTKGVVIGAWFSSTLLGFIQELMGPEAWTRWELEHWKEDWKTMPIQCVVLATTIVWWWYARRAAAREDKNCDERRSG